MSGVGSTEPRRSGGVGIAGAGAGSRGPLAAFVAFGLLWGTLAALAPALQTAVGASKGAFGLALLFVAVGSVPAMLLTGRELDRRGTRILPWLLAGMAASAVLPALAGSVPALAAGLLVVGVFTGATDVAMNAAVSELEAKQGTRLMQLAHALYSAGRAGRRARDRARSRAGRRPAAHPRSGRDRAPHGGRDEPAVTSASSRGRRPRAD